MTLGRVAAVAGVLLALGPWGGLVPPVRGAGTASCRRVLLADSAALAFSAAWSADGREVVLVDVPGGRLLRYDRDGRFLGSVARPGEGGTEFSKPTQIHATAKGFLLRNSARKWIWLDRAFKSLESVSAMDPEGYPVFNLADEVLTGDELAGFGSYQKSRRVWAMGLLRVGLKPLAVREVVEEIDISSKTGSFHNTLAPLVAQAAGRAYSLRFGEPPYLLGLHPKVRLKAFPAGFASLPALPENQGPQTTAPRQKAIEKSSLPVGLYGSRQFLYLLTHRPEPGGLLWQLHQIDPVRDKLVRSLTLPTTAHSLVIAPGSETWAVFEKGAVLPTGEQPVESLLLIPSAWIESPGAKGPSRLACS